MVLEKRSVAKIRGDKLLWWSVGRNPPANADMGLILGGRFHM